MADYIFVYGTLKRGYRAADLMDQCEYRGDATVRGHTLLDLGTVPVAYPCHHASAHVLGEVYKLPEDRAQANAVMGRLEFYETSFYKPVVVEAAIEGGETVRAIMFVVRKGQAEKPVLNSWEGSYV